SGEVAAMDGSRDGSRLERGDMTDGTANLIEMDGSSLGVSGGRQNLVSGRDFGRPKEIGEGVDSLMPGRLSMVVFWVRNGIALGDNLIREQAIGNPQVTEVSQCREGEQARRLALPAKTSYGKRDVATIKYRGDGNFACDVAVGLRRLTSGNGDERVVRNCFHKPVPQPAEGNSRAADRLALSGFR